VSRARELLTWYDRHRRRLPWRAEAGERAEPYHVWLSEIMLQQTTVATVGPYFRDFFPAGRQCRIWPRPTLIRCSMPGRGWAITPRARNLHRCARVVVEQYGGRFPDTEVRLRKLPGVGAYTAAAVAAIAFGRRATPWTQYRAGDGTALCVTDPLPGAKPNFGAWPRP